MPSAVRTARRSDVARDAVLDELDVPRDARLIGAIGRLWSQKRIKDLIWAYELVIILYPNARLLVIGDLLALQNATIKLEDGPPLLVF